MFHGIVTITDSFSIHRNVFLFNAKERLQESDVLQMQCKNAFPAFTHTEAA